MMELKPVELTLEQKFNLRSFETQVAQMSREQAQEMCIQLYEAHLVKDATYRHLLKHEWGLEQR